MPTKVYYATNRTEPKSKKGSYGKRFNEEGPQFFEVGTASVTFAERDGAPDWDDARVTISRDATDRPKEVASASTPQNEPPEMARKTAREHNIKSMKMFRKIRDEANKGGRHVLVYLHGFANDFDDGMARAAQLAKTYRAPDWRQEDGPAKMKEPIVFAFSWPSDGKVQPPWKYNDDRQDAELSGKAMARSFMRLADFLDDVGADGERCKVPIHIVAHSMGNWALRHALQNLKNWPNRPLEPVFAHAFLMASDEDDDALEKEHKLRPLLRLAKAVHVYHSAQDKALFVSDRTKGNPDRLGTHGPENMSKVTDRVTAIDCSAVDNTSLAHGNHQYYRLRAEVIEDVRQVMAGVAPYNVAGRAPLGHQGRYRILGEEKG